MLFRMLMVEIWEETLAPGLMYMLERSVIEMADRRSPVDVIIVNRTLELSLSLLLVAIWNQQLPP